MLGPCWGQASDQQLLGGPGRGHHILPASPPCLISFSAAAPSSWFLPVLHFPTTPFFHSPRSANSNLLFHRFLLAVASISESSCIFMIFPPSPSATKIHSPMGLSFLTPHCSFHAKKATSKQPLWHPDPVALTLAPTCPNQVPGGGCSSTLFYPETRLCAFQKLGAFRDMGLGICFQK